MAHIILIYNQIRVFLKPYFYSILTLVEQDILRTQPYLPYFCFDQNHNCK
jgi:hypothetical protein